jgi:hypothetical protein
MAKDAVVAFSITKRLNFRHLHKVAVGTVKGSASAVLNGHLGVGEKAFHTVEAIDCRIERGHSGIEMTGQVVDLLGIENRVAFHERNFDLYISALLVSAGLGDLVGIDDKRALLALADLAAKLGSLLVGQPQRAAVTPLDGRSPQHEHIDAAIRFASGAQRS